MYTRSSQRTFTSLLVEPLNPHRLVDIRRTMVDDLASHRDNNRAASKHGSAASFDPVSSFVSQFVDPVYLTKFIGEHERYEAEGRSEQTGALSLSVTL